MCGSSDPDENKKPRANTRFFDVDRFALPGHSLADAGELVGLLG